MHLRRADGSDPLRPQRPAGLGQGALLAVLVHGGLLLAFAFAVNWRASKPTPASVELWAAVPEFAAPAPVEPPPPPPQPKPVIKPEPAPQVAPPPPSRDAEIAVEKARREKERERELAREREARLEAEKKRQAALEEAQRKKLAEKAEQAAKAEKAAQAAKAEKAAQLAKAAQAEKLEQERLEKLRLDNLKRIQGQAGATGSPDATGSAARDAGPSASYTGRVIARVKPNIVFTDAIVGKPTASVEVRCAPDGTIVARRLVKSSGNKDWDEAVLRALDRTEILPRDVDGRVPSPMIIDFTPS